MPTELREMQVDHDQISAVHSPQFSPPVASVEATEARVREVVLVSSATARPISRNRVTASTAPGSGRHDTVRTPSMSINTARTLATSEP